MVTVANEHLLDLQAMALITFTLVATKKTSADETFSYLAQATIPRSD